MLKLTTSLLLILAGCAHKSTPENPYAARSRTYCGKAMEVQLREIFNKPDPGILKRPFSPIHPALAVWQHTEATTNTTTINFGFGMKEDLHLKLAETNVSYVIEGKSYRHQLNLQLKQVAKNLEQIYPSTQYYIQPSYDQPGLYQVRKKGFFGLLFAKEVGVFPAPKSILTYPEGKEIKTTFDDTKFQRIVIGDGFRIEHDKLPSNFQVKVTVPALEINGVKVAAETFEFTVAREEISRQSGQARCPNLEEIFHHL